VIAELFEAHRERLNELFDQTLNVIKDAFQARKIFVVRGVIVDGGPDRPDRGGKAVYPAGFLVSGLCVVCAKTY
jgi:hypothetical protein